MSETTERRFPLMVRRSSLRPGDILNADAVYTGDDETLGAVCENVTPAKGPYLSVTWRIVATGETYTDTFHKDDYVYLMRRAPGASSRDTLWDQLGIDPGRVSREEFEEFMDAYDQAASAGPARPDEEPTP